MENFDYRSILKQEFRKRQERNASYSQGAFARDLGLRPNRLSEVLSGKQGFSTALGKEIANRLNLNEDEHKLFCELIRERHGRSASEREEARRRLAELKKNISEGAASASPLNITIRNESDLQETLIKQISEAFAHLPIGAKLHIELAKAE